MLRRFRFGFLSIFALMLVAISAGGWWKFRRDLHLEEQAILAALAKAGCSVYVLREVPPEDPTKTPSPEETSFWKEHLQRIRVLSVSGDLSPELRRRLAAMPELELLQISEPPPSVQGTHATLPPIAKMPPAEAILGDAAPTLDEPRLGQARVGEPHPTGTPLSEAETTKLVEEIRHAWTNPRPPERFMRIVEEANAESVRTVYAREGDAWLVFEDSSIPSPAPGQLHIADEEASCVLERAEASWRLGTRMSSKLPEWNRLRPPSLDQYIFPKFHRRPDDLDHVASIERLEGNLVRLTFRPHDRNVGSRGPRISIEERSLILDGDLDWAPVSIREVHRMSFVPASQPSERVAQEFRFERIGGYVLPVEAVGESWRARIAWSIDPEFEPGTFSIEGYFDEPVPARKDLPFWRWYRLGFAISAASFAFLIGRSVAAFFQSRVRIVAPERNAS